MKLVFLGRDRFEVWALARDSGRCEVDDFLTELQRHRPADRAGLADLIQRMTRDGKPKSTTYCHHLGDGIFELRQGKARLLWFADEHNGRILLCTHGFRKETQRTPAAEIERARRERTVYRHARDRGQLTREGEP